MIRPGCDQDLGEIVRMAEQFWRHTLYDEDFDHETTQNMAKYCIDQDMMAVLETKGKVCGFACGVTGPLLASPTLSGTEVAWWVDPDHRHGGNGIKLLKFLEKKAKNKGVKYWTMIFMESSMPVEIESMYKKMHYAKSETSYTKVLI